MIFVTLFISVIYVSFLLLLLGWKHIVEPNCLLIILFKITCLLASQNISNIFGIAGVFTCITVMMTDYYVETISKVYIN